MNDNNPIRVCIGIMIIISLSSISFLNVRGDGQVTTPNAKFSANWETSNQNTFYGLHVYQIKDLSFNGYIIDHLFPYGIDYTITYEGGQTEYWDTFQTGQNGDGWACSSSGTQNFNNGVMIEAKYIKNIQNANYKANLELLFRVYLCDPYSAYTGRYPGIMVTACFSWHRPVLDESDKVTDISFNLWWKCLFNGNVQVEKTGGFIAYEDYTNGGASTWDTISHRILIGASNWPYFLIMDSQDPNFRYITSGGGSAPAMEWGEFNGDGLEDYWDFDDNDNNEGIWNTQVYHAFYFSGDCSDPDYNYEWSQIGVSELIYTHGLET